MLHAENVEKQSLHLVVLLERRSELNISAYFAQFCHEMFARVFMTTYSQGCSVACNLFRLMLVRY